MKRRKFLQTSAMMAAAISVAPSALAAKTNKSADQSKEDKSTALIDSYPVLQNYAPTSIGIAFGVSSLANGFVIYGREPDLNDGKKVYCGGYRVTDANDAVMLVRLTELEPSTTYYYKIGADRIHYGGGYDMKVEETITDSVIYSFHTAGEDTAGHFCVINDTHAHWDNMNRLQEKIAQLNPSCVVWNGDACNSDETVDDLKDIFFNRLTEHQDFAVSRPYMFNFGNHEGRCFAGRHLERIWMTRQPDERPSRDWNLGRNFAVRVGDIAMIGLDTGEDKVDTNPKFANLFLCKPYREAQAKWLRDALQRPDIASAPYVVAFCHIPLFDDNPRSNPGDIYPADDDPQYDTDFAIWQRTCYQLWNPLLEEAHCQLVVAAHTHHHRYDAPSEKHSWAQVVGGGWNLKEGAEDYPTIIEGKAKDGNLTITVHNMSKGTIEKQFTLKPRF